MQYRVKCFAEIDVHFIYAGFLSQDVNYRGFHCLFCHHLFSIFIIRDPVIQGQKGQQLGQKEIQGSHCGRIWDKNDFSGPKFGNICRHIKQEFQCICSIKGVIAAHILKSTTF